jgi:hypothetical protein
MIQSNIDYDIIKNCSPISDFSERARRWGIQGKKIFCPRALWIVAGKFATDYRLALL